MEPITIVFDDEKLHSMAAFVKKTAEGRREELGDLAHPLAFVAGAMSVYFALGIENKMPAAWYFRALSGEDPFTGELIKPDHDRRVVDLLKRRLERHYEVDIQPKTGWLTPWGAYFPTGWGQHGNFATLAQDVVHLYEEDNDLDAGELDHVFNGWLTLNFDSNEEHMVYATMNGRAELTPEQVRTLNEIIETYPGSTYAKAADKALRSFDHERKEYRDHWFVKTY